MLCKPAQARPRICAGARAWLHHVVGLIEGYLTMCSVRTSVDVSLWKEDFGCCSSVRYSMVWTHPRGLLAGFGELQCVYRQQETCRIPPGHCNNVSSEGFRGVRSTYLSFVLSGRWPAAAAPPLPSLPGGLTRLPIARICVSSVFRAASRLMKKVSR